MHRIFGGSKDFLKVFPKNRSFGNFTVDSSLKNPTIYSSSNITIHTILITSRSQKNLSSDNIANSQRSSIELDTD